MRVFRQKYNDSRGRSRTAPRWYVEIADLSGHPRKVAAYTDKALSQMEQVIEDVITEHCYDGQAFNKEVRKDLKVSQNS